MTQIHSQDVPVVELRHVDKHYGALHVLKDISLRVGKGEVVVIIGPSGSGKSTLCRTVNRLETVDSGKILIEGVPLPQEGRQLAALRSRIGMVFQSFNLFSHMTVLDNMILAPMGVLKLNRKAAKEEAMALLERVGVADQAHKLPAQLSGGQQQRCAIARAVIKNPRLLLCDEPTGALDSVTSREILTLLGQINRDYRTTILLVTHNAAIRRMCHKVIAIRDGRIVEETENENPCSAQELEDL